MSLIKSCVFSTPETHGGEGNLRPAAQSQPIPQCLSAKRCRLSEQERSCLAALLLLCSLSDLTTQRGTTVHVLLWISLQHFGSIKNCHCAQSSCQSIEGPVNYNDCNYGMDLKRIDDCTGRNLEAVNKLLNVVTW